MATITIVSLCALLVISYKVFEGDIVSPSFIFIATFTVSFLDMVLNLKTWNTTISVDTVFIILMGAILFTLFSIIIHAISTGLGKDNILKDKLPDNKVYINVDKWKLILFFIFQCIVIFFMQKYIRTLTAPYGTNGSLSSAISMYQYLNKFTTLNLEFPKLLTYSFIISSSSSFVWGYISIHNFYFFRKINSWLIINLLVSLGGSFLTGSRGVALQAVMSLIVLYIMLYRDGQKKIHLRKIIIKPLLLVVGILLTFKIFAGLLGRDHSLGLFEYISVYLGAPIKNLDTFLTSSPDNSYIVWGYNTFSMQWRWISDALNLGIPKDTINTSFQFLNGHNLGNVFTAYKDFIMDFGYMGAMLCIIFMAIVMAFIYENTRGLKEKWPRFKIDWMRIVYSYLVVAVGFTFFSNKFYETFTVTFIQRILCWILLGYLFCNLIGGKEAKNETITK